MPPTLPKNINPINIPLEIYPSDGVIPSVNPTVPIAELVSNSADTSGNPSIALISIPPPKNKTTYIIKIVAAFFTASSDILLPHNCADSFF